MPGHAAAAVSAVMQYDSERNSISSKDLSELRSSSLSVACMRDARTKDYFYSERKRVRELLRNHKFDFAIGVVILSNCFTIGLEQSWDLEGKDTSVLQWLEHSYLIIYIIEIGLRFFGYGISCLKDSWVKFDLLLVVIGVTIGWILSPILGQVDSLGPLMVLRTARLMRLARTVRLLVKFRELWMLVRGLLNSASTMFYTMLMLFIIIYLFSCMSIEIVTNHSLAVGPDADPEFQAFVQDNFRNLPLTMMTLLQFASLDNMNLIYMPLVRKSWWLAFFFIAVILVISIALMNLITAVVVNSALEQAMSDKDAMKAHEAKERKRKMKELRALFVSLDDDDSGCVSRAEMEQMKPEDKQLFQNILGTSDAMEVFSQLDVDGSGELEIDEFCDGILLVASSKVPIEFKRLERQVAALERFVQGSMERMEALVGLAVNPDSAAADILFTSEGSGDGDCVHKPHQKSHGSPARKNMNPGGDVNHRHRPGSPFRKQFSMKPHSRQVSPLALNFGGLGESLVQWRAKIVSELEKAVHIPLSTQLQELSSQVQQVLLELKDGNTTPSTAGPKDHSTTWPVFQSDRCSSEPNAYDATAEVPRWAEDLRQQLFNTAESIRQPFIQTTESITVTTQEHFERQRSTINPTMSRMSRKAKRSNTGQIISYL